MKINAVECKEKSVKSTPPMSRRRSFKYKITFFIEIPQEARLTVTEWDSNNDYFFFTGFHAETF